MTDTTDTSDEAVERLRRWRDVGDGPIGYTAGNTQFADDVIALLAERDRLQRADEIERLRAERDALMSEAFQVAVAYGALLVERDRLREAVVELIAAIEDAEFDHNVTIAPVTLRRLRAGEDRND